VSLDGTPLSMPFSGEFQRSGALHQLEAVADGYRPFKRLISFDRKQDIEIALNPSAQPVAQRAATRGRAAVDKRSETAVELRGEPVIAPSAPAAPSVSTPPAAAEKREPGSQMVSKPKLVRGLDRADPYATQ
jgi:hypothetical protein